MQPVDLHNQPETVVTDPGRQSRFDVGVTIISFNHRDLLEECLRAVETSIASSEVTAYIAVLDNASRDGSAEMVRDLFPKVHLIARSDVRGFSTNQNELFATCRNTCEYVLMLNDDAIVGQDTIKRLLAAIETDSQMAVIGPKLVYPDGTYQTAGERLPGFWSHLLRHLGLGRFVPDRLRFLLGGRNMPAGDGHSIRRVGYVIGACALVRSRALENVGLLDERFRMYGEDADWCFEASRLGWWIGADPSVVVVHHRKQSWSRFSVVERERGMFTYLRKRGVDGMRLMLLRSTFLTKYRLLLSLTRNDNEKRATLRSLIDVGRMS